MILSSWAGEGGKYIAWTFAKHRKQGALTSPPCRDPAPVQTLLRVVGFAKPNLGIELFQSAGLDTNQDLDGTGTGRGLSANRKGAPGASIKYALV